MESTRLTYIAIGIVAALGCGGSQVRYSLPRPPRAAAAGTVTTSSPLERTLLSKLDELSAGQALKSVEGTAVVESTYLAANGRHCRTVHLRFTTQPSVDRLACRDGERWFFVPALEATTAQAPTDLARRESAPKVAITNETGP